MAAVRMHRSGRKSSSYFSPLNGSCECAQPAASGVEPEQQLMLQACNAPCKEALCSRSAAAVVVQPKMVLCRQSKKWVSVVVHRWRTNLQVLLRSLHR